MTSFEKKICDFINRNAVIIGFAAVIILSLLLRIAMFENVTSDYSFFMSSWIKQLNEYPGISGIGQNIGEYNVPYMLFLALIGKTSANDLHEIKFLSMVFDYVGVFFALMIISRISQIKFFSLKNLVAASVMLFNPVFFLNSAFWAQCDFIYTALCFASLYLILKEKYGLSMAVYGLAIALKLQAIFFLPVLIIFYLASRKMKIFNFFWIFVVFVVAALPAVFAGRGLVDSLTIYLDQTSLYKQLTMACPNIFTFITGEYEVFSKVGIILAFAVLGVGACLLMRRGSISPKNLVLVSVWSSLTCIYFLPAMHERYAFMACAFSIVWAFVCRRDWWVALGINLVCFMSYTPYLFRTTVLDMKYLALANLVFLAYVSYRLFCCNETPNTVSEIETKVKKVRKS